MGIILVLNPNISKDSFISDKNYFKRTVNYLKHSILRKKNETIGDSIKNLL